MKIENSLSRITTFEITAFGKIIDGQNCGTNIV